MARAVAALAALAGLLFGVPWALLAWGRPGALLGVDWARALLVPDDGTLLLAGLSLIGWVAWAVVAWTTVAELVGVISRGRVRVPTPGAGWLRPMVAGLVAAALAPVVSAMAAPPAEAPPQTVSAPLLAEPANAQTEVDPRPVHVVRVGDELWSLAEEFLGSGERWREIADQNPGLSITAQLAPGSTLRLPAEAAPPAPEPQPEVITVQRGDTLWDLAQEHLGDAERWPELFRANRDVVADPDEIDIGWELVIPETASAGPRTSPEAVEVPPAVPSNIPPASGTTADPEPPPRHLGPNPDATAAPAPDEGTDPPAVVGGELPPPMPTVPPAATLEAAVPSTSEVATPRPQPETQQQPETADEAAEGIEAAALLGPIGGMLAAGIVLGVAARRRTQLLARAVGRRLIPVSGQTARFWTGLARRAEELPPAAAAPTPTSVGLGWIGDELTRVDLEANRCTLIAGEPELALGLTATAITGLVCVPWSESVELVVVASDDAWAAALDDPRVSEFDHTGEALVALQKLCAQRRLAMGSGSLEALRANDDLRSAWAPVVYVFCGALVPAQVDQVLDCLSLGEVGVSVLARVAAPTEHDEVTLVSLHSEESATMTGQPAFAPQLLSAPARRAVIELFSSATSDATEPAPWWRHEATPANVSLLPHQEATPEDLAMQSRVHDTPTITLLGPPELVGARGAPPSRARVQCIEYCTWLLEHPRATPTQMAQALLVAEGTRRSNVSRLRAWLGSDDDGAPYLPDAYSGRITLSPEVTSDWEHFQSLLSGGVNYASSPILREALSLVQGEPLQGVGFQWGWADDLRRDMVSMITDAAATLADRAMERGDLDGARWAIAQGRLAAGSDDEVLAAREIHAFALAGDRPRLETAVRQLTRHARATGRDLQPETAQRVQQALHMVVTGSSAN